MHSDDAVLDEVPVKKGRAQKAREAAGVRPGLILAGLIFLAALAYAGYKFATGETGLALLVVLIGAGVALVSIGRMLLDFATEWVIGGMSKRVRHIAAGVLGVWLVCLLAYQNLF